MDIYNKVYQTWDESSHPSEDSKIIYGPHDQPQYEGDDDHSKLTIFHDFKDKVSIFKEDFSTEIHYLKVEGIQPLRTLLVVFNIIKIESSTYYPSKNINKRKE
jgi:hypothetical protein|tara:strand:+ start:53 stop:361 length:309 start_codon:yes stop_codon:yes gene_type:complete